MYRFDRYYSLLEENPSLFWNDTNPNSIRIITDPSIIAEQQKVLYTLADTKHEPHSWYDLGVLAEDEWVLVIRDLVIMPNGSYGRYIRTINKTSIVNATGHDVVILPILQHKIVLLNHFRHEKRAWLWEIPRGFGEAGLSPEQNARKELLEETSLKIDQLYIIGGQKEDGSYGSIVYFLAVVSGEPSTRDTEGIDTFKQVTVHEFEDMILQGKMTDPYTIKAYTYANLHHLLS